MALHTRPASVPHRGLSQSPMTAPAVRTRPASVPHRRSTPLAPIDISPRRHDDDGRSRTDTNYEYRGVPPSRRRVYAAERYQANFAEPSSAQMSESEDENDDNDISQASFDIGSGALASNSKLKVSKQKENLEAKLSETELVADPQPRPDVSLHTIEGKTTYNAITSSYMMEDYSGNSSDISIHIEYLANIPVSRRRDRSIFRWIHLKQENMDFDLFSRCSREMPGLPEDQIPGLSQFLRRVRKELERTIRSQRGPMGNFMIPGLITKKSPTENSDGSLDRTYAFCCLPYHQLAPYSPLGATANSRLHPVRTLLQSKYPSTTKQREFGQAVRSVSGTPSNHVFHTSNLWCLIINNKFMTTSASGLSAHDISGDCIKFVPNVPPQPARASILPESVQVLVNNRLYVLPLSQCDSWFKFTQNFSRYTLVLHDQYTIKWKGAIITSELWPLIVQQAQKEIIYILLSPRKRPIIRGHEEGPTEEDLEDLTLGPHTPNNDRLSVISEVDSIRSQSSGRGADREIDNSSPMGSTSHSHKSSRDYLQSPNQTDRKSSPQTSRSSSPTPGIIDLREFHVLIWIAIRLGKAKHPETKESDLNITNPAVKIDEIQPKSDRELVNAYLNSVHSWLENQNNKKASTLYRKGAQKSLDDVERAMQGMLRIGLDQPDIDTSKIRLIKAVKSIFNLFLPLEQRNLMCSKLWGALHLVITAAIPKESLRQINSTIVTLGQVAVLANTLKAQLSDGNAPPPEDLSMPPDTLRVWHQLLLCLLFWSPKTMALSQSYARKSLGLLQKAHRDLMKNPKAKKLDKVEAVLPNGLLAAVISHIISDFTGTQPGLVDSYWEYFDQLEIKVGKEPLDRHNQAVITAFIGEVRIVLNSLEQQQSVVDAFEDGMLSFDENIGSIRPPDLAQLFLGEALDSLGGKINSMEELLELSQDLLELNAEALRHNKDKQEAAIYIFTIVTIVFLPVSTVASVLGMNTNDVRNMDKTQWVFWATAVPLTVIVIVISLFAAGILAWPFRRRVNLSLIEGEPEPTRKTRARRRRERSPPRSRINSVEIYDD